MSDHALPKEVTEARLCVSHKTKFMVEHLRQDLEESREEPVSIDDTLKFIISRYIGRPF